MEVLPDIVGPAPVIVFCGLAGADSTKHRDHYYASPGNNFWECVHLSGLTPRRLRPEEDRTLVEHALGLTDLVGHWDHESNRGAGSRSSAWSRPWSAGSRRSSPSPPRAPRRTQPGRS